MNVRTFKWLAGALLPLVLWVGVKTLFHVPERYLPGPLSVLTAADDLGWPLVDHAAMTIWRTATGFLLGTISGVAAALLFFRFRTLPLVMPLVNALRSMPPVAAVPFFLLWFGFSEWGRYLLVMLGLGLNVMVASVDIFEREEETDTVIFRNFGLPRESLVLSYWLPRIAESLLPTLRFGLSLALGLIAVSEMLGAQLGLGYLMQTARATFSLNVLFLCAFILGIIGTLADAGLRWAWPQLVTWRR